MKKERKKKEEFFFAHWDFFGITPIITAGLPRPVLEAQKNVRGLYKISSSTQFGSADVIGNEKDATHNKKKKKDERNCIHAKAADSVCTDKVSDGV